MADPVVVQTPGRTTVVQTVSKAGPAVVTPAAPSTRVVEVRSGLPGRPGERGADAEAGAFGSSPPLLVWMMQHDLDLEPEEHNPRLWSFRDTDGEVMEPIDVVYSTSNVSLALWDSPVAGFWRVR